ncbi:MAG: UDP-N-acetylglucosamine 2-epimerase (non-hydrolyzing) [SAR324 cluster bacterium]|nr:UDP-N-acetylglucosamine 2-epimerase (non-hydrolyzing) [SAR324 cluster bacterium]
MKVLNVVGARPNFMKVAPLHAALQAHGAFQSMIVHTGQHYDEKMSDIFFRQLELPQPDVYLGIGGGSHAEQTGKIMMAFEKIVLEGKPDLVVVVGDVNSTLACSIVSAKCHIPLAHVEAGLRSRDREMPEEINRLVTDSVADYLLVTEQSGVDNLRAEGVAESKIYFVGNVMIDSLVRFREKAAKTSILQELSLSPKSFVLMTMHRPSNVDTKSGLQNLLQIIEHITSLKRVVFPIHPRTRKQFATFGLDSQLHSLSNLTLLDPLGYLEFLNLMENASLLVTDSGGVQEETTYLQVPCLTLRENTERPVTIELGTNELLSMDAHQVNQRVSEILASTTVRGTIPPLWDGHASERIADIFASKLFQNQE